jgi:hypothetical protein
LTRGAPEPKTTTRDPLRRLAIISVFLLACGEKSGVAPCEAVGTRFLLLAKADLDATKVDDDNRRLVLDQLPAMRDSLVNACKESKWEPAVRTCMADAPDHLAFESCERALTPAQRDALERGVTDEH